jgi:anthranilate synthase component II
MPRDLIRSLPARSASGLAVYVAASPAAPFSTSLGMTLVNASNRIRIMLLLIDNYDSFTYNLAQYFGELGCELVVRRNDSISLKEIDALAPERICISPGPCTPREAGISKDVVLAFGARTPILGVCLGHQCVAEAYGGEIVRASRLMHGKASTIRHNGNSLFSSLARSFEAGRYHSLVVKRASLPGCLEITAESDDGEIMALCHREFPVYGVQFHPESVLTHDGKKILARFLAVEANQVVSGFNPVAL